VGSFIRVSGAGLDLTGIAPGHAPKTFLPLRYEGLLRESLHRKYPAFQSRSWEYPPELQTEKMERVISGLSDKTISCRHAAPAEEAAPAESAAIPSS